MKYGTIDIGSNSVRLMMSEGTDTLFKEVEITGLSEGMGESGVIMREAAHRTYDAVSFFIDRAKSLGAEKIFVFGTAALRNAKNSDILTDEILSSHNIKVDIISGETEAKLGAMGALLGVDGAIIDIGGASTEISVVKNGGFDYSKSVKIGVVKVKDACGQNESAVEKFIEKYVGEFRGIKIDSLVGIGGTATSLASLSQELSPYDPKKVDGYFLSKKEIIRLKDKLYSLPVSEIAKLKGLQPKRAEVIAGGAMILLSVIEMLGISGIKVSEKDNLEGYLQYILEKYE